MSRRCNLGGAIRARIAGTKKLILSKGKILQHETMVAVMPLKRSSFLHERQKGKNNPAFVAIYLYVSLRSASGSELLDNLHFYTFTVLT